MSLPSITRHDPFHPMDSPAPLSAERQKLLAQRLKGFARQGGDSRQIPARPKGEPAPLSPGQHQMWVIDQMTPGNPAYNVAVAYRIGGNLNVSALEEGFNKIIERHIAWRTTFRENGSDAIQEIHPACAIQIRVTSLEHLPHDEREVKARALAAAEAVQPFDLRRLPLIRVSLFKLAPEDHVLLITFHHIVGDGISLNLVFDELDALYRAASAGTQARLPDVPVQYADFAAWQRAELSKEQYAAQFEYWQRQLSGDLPVLEIPTDRKRPARQSFNGSNIDFNIPKPLAQALTQLATKEKTTFFVAALTAYQILLARYSKAEELVVGMPIANRPLQELERVIGNFINVVALRCDVSGNPTVTELVRRSRETALNALSNKDIPFEMAVQRLQLQRDPSRNPVFQALLQVLPPVRMRLGDLSLSRFDFELRFSQVDLTLHFYEETDGGYHGQIQYCTDLYTAGTVERLARNLVQLLGEIARDPDRSIWEIPIVAESERNELLVEWNRTAVDYPDATTLQALFERQAAATPEAVAVEYDRQQLTYGELNGRANQLARHLRELGLAHGACVGVCMERSPELIVSILAIVKAGGAYVPLDTASPPERLALMIEESASEFVLTRADGLGLMSQTTRRVLNFDTVDLSQYEATSLAEGGGGGDLAYVIFTSGSTGKPKGVAVPHRAIARLVINSDYVQFVPDDVVAHVSNVAFDAATFEIWGALLNGARLVVVPRDVLLSNTDFASFLAEHKVTTTFLTTTLFNQIALENPGAFSPLKNLLVGGEACNPEAFRRVLGSRAPQRLLNAYGPTETTTFAICNVVREMPADAITVPIGQPIANTTVYILDSRMQLAPCGAIGEICIGGPGLAIGYVNDPQLTAERFVETQFGRLYRSGDLGRRRDDGTIECYGRVDAQLKLRGFRIEPGEIESALLDHASVHQAAIVPLRNASSGLSLVAYLVSCSGKQATTTELRDFLSHRLPSYMIPSYFVWMESLPLTGNGKLNLRALPQPETEAKTAREYAPPQNSVHQHLIEIWEEVLNRKPIGIRDNFFELGGHSLLAARVIALTTERLGHRLPFAEFFANPTIEAHTRTLINTQVAVRQIPYALINADGKKAPVFFFHGDYVGGGFFCKTLASSIGVDRPFYALHPHGLQGDEVPMTIEQMAKDRLKQIREIQPRGPYILGGYCNGALIAFHAARLLREAGEQVSTVLMLNAVGTNVRFGWLKRTVAISAAIRQEDEAKAFHRFLNAHKRLSDLDEISRYYVRAAADLTKQPWRQQAARVWRKFSRLVGLPVRSHIEALAQQSSQGQNALPLVDPPGPLSRPYRAACCAYVPRRYDGPVVLLWPREEPPPSSRGPAGGWDRICTQVSVVEVPGHHHSCISLNANVAQVGHAMRKAIEQAECVLTST